MESITTSPEKSGIVPKIVQDGVKNILVVANGVLYSNRNGREHESHHSKPVNFTQLFEEAKKDQSLYKGYHLTFFEEDPMCRLDVAGYTAKVYWLWQTGSKVPKTVWNCTCVRIHTSTYCTKYICTTRNANILRKCGNNGAN